TKSNRAVNKSSLFSKAESAKFQQIIVPSYVAGFQGIAVGIFKKLPARLELFAIDQLEQFASTLGERIASQREGEYKAALAQASSISDCIDAVMTLLPPVEHAIFVSETETNGLGINREGEYLAGYRKLNSEEINVARVDQENELIALSNKK